MPKKKKKKEQPTERTSKATAAAVHGGEMQEALWNFLRAAFAGGWDVLAFLLRNRDCAVNNVPSGRGDDEDALRVVQAAAQQGKLGTLLAVAAEVRAEGFRRSDTLCSHLYEYALEPLQTQDIATALSRLELFLKIRPKDVGAKNLVQLIKRREELTRLVKEHEQNEDWDGQQATLRALVSDWPKDSESKRKLAKLEKLEEDYQEAQRLMGEGDFDTARQVFRSVVRRKKRYRDASKRARDIEQCEELYTHAMQAIKHEQWQEAIDRLQAIEGSISDYRNARKLLENLERCFQRERDAKQAIAEGRWDDAVRACQEIVEIYRKFGSAEGMLKKLLRWETLYERAVAAVEEKKWEEARNKLEELLAENRAYKDSEDLLALVTTVERCVKSLRERCVPYPRCPWPGKHPYTIFGEAGVSLGPTDDMESVHSALQRVQAGPREVGDETTTSAWDFLKRARSRLLADAFLLNMPDPSQAINLLEKKMALNRRLPTNEEIQHEVPGLAPQVMVLLDRVDGAIDFLEQRVASGDGKTTDCFMLSMLHYAMVNRVEGEKTLVDRHWKRAIAYLAVALLDEGYWQDWVGSRGAAYEAFLPADTHDELRGELADRIRVSLAKTGSDDLIDAFDVEMQAARTVKSIGGIPLDGDHKFVGGPLLAEQQGALSFVARYVTEYEASPPDVGEAIRDDLPLEQTVRTTRCFFSSLAVPTGLVHGEHGNSGRALTMLAEAHCSKCPSVSDCQDPDCTTHRAPLDSIRVSVCCSQCRQFDKRNPSYAELPRKGVVLFQDAVTLLAHAHMRLAKDALGSAETGFDFNSFKAHWEHTFECVRYVGSGTDVGAEVLSQVKSQANWLDQQQNKEYGAMRLEAGIWLLRNARRFSPDDTALLSKLAELLTDKGVKEAYQNNESSVAALREARALVPFNHRTCANLGKALAILAHEVGTRGDMASATALLEEANHVIAHGLRRAPEFSQYTESKEMIDEVEEALRPEGGKGGKDEKDEKDEKDDRPHIAVLDKVLGQKDLPETPSEADVQPENPLDDIAGKLDDVFLRYRRVSDSVILLSFDSPYSGYVRVRLTVENGFLVIFAALDVEPKDDQILDILLVASQYSPFFRTALLPSHGAGLLCRTPIAGLDSEMLEVLTRAAARYVDMPSVRSMKPEDVRSHFDAEGKLFLLACPAATVSTFGDWVTRSFGQRQNVTVDQRAGGTFEIMGLIEGAPNTPLVAGDLNVYRYFHLRMKLKKAEPINLGRIIAHENSSTGPFKFASDQDGNLLWIYETRQLGDETLDDIDRFVGNALADAKQRFTKQGVTLF